MEDPHTILQIPRSASQHQVKEAYRAQLRLHRPSQFPRASEARAEAEAQIARIEAAYQQLHEPLSPLPSTKRRHPEPRFALSLPHTTLLFIGFLVLTAVAIALMAAWLRPVQKPVLINPEELRLRSYRLDARSLQNSGSEEIPPSLGNAGDRVIPSAPPFVDASPEPEPLPPEVAQQVAFEFDNPGDDVVKGTLINHTEWAITEVRVEFSRQYFDGDFVANADKPLVALRLEQQPVAPGGKSQFAYDLRDHLVPMDIAGEPTLPAMHPVEVTIKGLAP